MGTPYNSQYNFNECSHKKRFSYRKIEVIIKNSVALKYALTSPFGVINCPRYLGMWLSLSVDCCISEWFTVMLTLLIIHQSAFLAKYFDFLRKWENVFDFYPTQPVFGLKILILLGFYLQTRVLTLEFCIFRQVVGNQNKVMQNVGFDWSVLVTGFRVDAWRFHQARFLAQVDLVTTRVQTNLCVKEKYPPCS